MKEGKKQLESKEEQGMVPVSREELLKLVHRREKGNFKFPKDFDNTGWKNKNFLAWRHPSGHKAYILEQRSGKNRLWVLTCNPKPNQNLKAVMCDCCYYVHGAGSRGATSFTYTPERNRDRKISFYLCSNLECDENATKISPNSMREGISNEEREKRMLKRFDEIVGVWSDAEKA